MADNFEICTMCGRKIVLYDTPFVLFDFVICEECYIKSVDTEY